MVDLGYLYGFIQELESLCVSGVASRSSPCQELISNQAFDISLFKSLQKLQVRRFLLVFWGHNDAFQLSGSVLCLTCLLMWFGLGFTV